MDDKIIFYSTHCPMCRGVELQLKKKNIKYEEIYINPNEPNEVQVMLDLGLKGAPGLVVNGRVMNAAEATKWIKEQ